MDETKNKLLPGISSTQAAQGEKSFAKIALLLEATGGLSLSQVCAVTGLEDSTIQNWVKRGWVAHPKGKRYEEKHIARILIINALKDCIKLEHIARLMAFVNGVTESGSDENISESNLYNYLCNALLQLGSAEDLSRSGVESVVDIVIKDYEGPTPHARIKIRKTLALMIYACVCTDVKRRTESMMHQILDELDNPQLFEQDYANVESSENVEQTIAQVDSNIDRGPSNDEPAAQPVVVVEETRKTVAQAIREWDLARVEDILNEDSGEHIEPSVEDSEPEVESDKQQTGTNEDKSTQKPWYFRRN